MTFAFVGIAEEGLNRIRAGDDAAQVDWLDIEELPEDMAFDHNEIAKLGKDVLKRGKKRGV